MYHIFVNFNMIYSEFIVLLQLCSSAKYVKYINYTKLNIK